MPLRECLQQWQNDGKWFKYRGHSIFCQLTGAGEPLVLIHGFPSSSWDWAGMWKSLSSVYRVITLDMTGFGFSDKPTKYEYSILDQANLFESILAEMGISECHLICHDYGDSVGQELLAREVGGQAKIRIKSVCFLNGGLFPETHTPALIQKLLIGNMGQFVSRFITKSVMDQNMRRIFGPLTQPTYTQLKEFWQLLEYNNGRAVLHRLLAYLEERQHQRGRWVTSMMQGHIPLCLIAGMDDPIAGSEMVERYKSLIKNPYVVELQGVGHYPHVEIPQQVFEDYQMFRERFSGVVAH